MARNLGRLAFLFGILGFAFAAAPASAQISQANAPGVYGAPYRNNIAFDAVNGVYLVIVQRPPVMGRFLDINGVQIGSDFRIALEPGDPFTAWVSVAFGGPPNDPSFLVTYTIADLTLNPKFGRLVRYVPGGAPSVGAPSFITNVGTEWVFSEKAQNVWNGQMFVVGSRVIQPGGTLPTPQVNLFDMNGSVSGPVYLGDGGDYYGSPAIACTPGGICLTVGFKAGIATGFSGGTYGRLFEASTLTPTTGLLTLESGMPNEDQGVVFVAHTGLFLTEWFRGGGAGFIDTRLVSPDGTMSAIDYSRGIGPGAGNNSIAYNPRTRTSLLTTKGSAAELLVYELGDDGYPVNPANALLLTPWDGLVLDYLPSNAADTNNARWLVSYQLQGGGEGKLIQGTDVGGSGVLPVSILTSGTLPAATAGVAYNQILIANGSTPPYTWSLVSGSMPTGIGLNGGSITGTASVAGVYNFTLRVAGGDGQAIERNFTLRVLEVIVAGSGPAGAHITGLSSEGLGNGHVHRNNAAYDPVNQVYLVITQRPPVMGRFLNRDGVQIGSDFRIALEAGDPFTAWVSIAFGGPANDPAFLVTYTVADLALNPKYGRLVRYVPGGAPSVSDPSFITNVGTEWLYSEKATNLWNGQRFVIGTRVMPPGTSLPGPQVNLFDMNGVVSGPVNLGDGLDYYGSPAIACAANGICLAIGFKAGISTGFSGGTYARRFDGGALSPQGNLFNLATGLPNEDQGVVYQAHTGRFLAAWFRGGGGGFIDTRLIGTDGTMSVLDLSRGIGPGAGGNTVAYNAATQTTLLTNKGIDAELLVMELGDNGYPVDPGNVLLVTPWDWLVLDYLPSLAADPVSARWLLTFELQASGYKKIIQGTPAGSSSGCTYSLSPTASGVFTAGGGSASLGVTTGASCSWSATPGELWIHTSSSGTGNGTVGYTVDPNPGASRSGGITVGGQVYAVSQAAASSCSYAVNPGNSGTLPSNAGGGSFGMTTSGSCAWTATTAASWIHTSSSGTGNGTVTFTVDANPGAARSGTILAGGQSFSVNQAANTSSAQKAQLVSPVPGSALTNTTVTFTWSPGVGVAQYWLEVGTSLGGYEIVSRDMGAQLTTDVTGLPNDGTVLYVRVYSYINGVWEFNDYTLTSSSPFGTQAAQLISPAAGSTLTSSAVTFQWSGGTGVSQYGLQIGSTPGASDLFSLSGTTSLSTAVSGLPTDGRTIYVRLQSLINGSWLASDYLLTAMAQPAAQKAQLVSPAPSSTLTGSAVTFQWSGGTAVTRYWLDIGSVIRAADVFTQDMGTSLSVPVNNLPTDGRTLYVRLFSQINGTWEFNDYTLTASSAPATQKAELISPAPGSTLTSTTATFQWTGGTGVAQYWLEVGTTLGGYEIVSRDMGTQLTTDVGGLPDDGTVLYVRVYSYINGTWEFNSYTLMSLSPFGAQTAQLISPAAGSTLSSSAVTFQWSGGTGVSQYGLQVGTSPGASDLFNLSGTTNLSAAVSGLPTDGRTIYVRLQSLINGSWLASDYLLTAMAQPTAQKAQLVSPAPSSTLTGSAVTFQWSGGTAVTRYWLDIGSVMRAADVFTQDMGTSLSVPVNNLPTDGRTLYVRLFSQINGTWEFNDYTLTASSAPVTQKAELISPAPGSTLTSTTVTFEWTGGTGVAQYWLEIGTTPGGYEIMSRDMGWHLDAVVGGLPNDGRTLYVRVYSYINGVWQFNDYTLTAASGSGSDPR